MKKRGSLTLALSVMLFVALLAYTGCSAKSDADSASAGAAKTTAETAAEKKDQLVIALNFDPGTMNPYEGSFGPQLVITTQTLETLFLYDVNGDLKPWLVTDYKYDPGNMGITLNLRDDVYFHNGDKMTAEDVLYSFTALKNSRGASAMTSVLDKDNITAVDEYTIHIPARFPCGTITHILSNMFVVNKNTYAADSAAGGGFNGTGPWKVKDWKAGVSVSFDSFKDYWGGAPAIDHLVIRIITESSVRMIELENGTVDIYKSASTEDINRVKRGDSKRAKIWRANSSQTIFYLGYNCSHEPFNNVKVRQALNYALDRESIVTAVFEGKGEVSTSLFPGGMWYSPDMPVDLQYKYDAVKAKTLLAEAGYPDGLEVTLCIDSNSQRRAMAEMIPSMMAKAGITVNINFMESAAFNAYMLNENDYDMFLWNFGNLFEPSGAMSTITVDNNRGGGSGKWHYAEDPAAQRIDNLLKIAQSTADDDERAGVYYDMAKLWAENAFSSSIVDQYDVNIVASNLSGMYFSPNINVQNAFYE